MFRISKISATGINRFKQSEVTLPSDDAIWLITGKNLDSNKADSNGAGKTGVFNVVSWTLFGDIPGKGAEPLIIGGDGNAYGLVELVDGENILRVKRVAGKGSGLFLYYNDVELPGSGEGTTKPQVVLNKYLGILDTSKDTFNAILNTTYLTFDFVHGFADVDTTPANRIALLTKYLMLDKIDQAVESVKKLRDALKPKLAELEAKRNSLIDTQTVDMIDANLDIEKSAIKGIEAQIVKLQDEFLQLPDVEAMLKKHMELGDALHKIELRESNELAPLRARYATLEERVCTIPDVENNIKSLSSDNGDSIKEEILVADQTLAKINESVGGINPEIRAKDAEILKLKSNNSTLQCPCCNENLLMVEGKLVAFDVAQHKHAISCAELDRDRLIAKRAELLDVRDSCSRDKDSLRHKYDVVLAEWQHRNVLVKELETLRQYESDLTVLDEQGMTLSQEIKEQRQALLDAIEALLPKSDVESAKQMRQSVKEQIAVCERNANTRNTNIAVLQDRRKTCIEKAEKLAEVEKYLADVLSEMNLYNRTMDQLPRFRANELSNAVPLLEDVANACLSGMGCNFRLNFDVKLLTNRVDFAILVTDDVGIKRGFGTFSGGERQRIALACALAQRDLASKAGGFLFDFMLLDEVFDGLDTQGREALILYLANKGGQYFIITHGGMQELVKDVIQVVRQDGVAQFGTLRK